MEAMVINAPVTPARRDLMANYKRKRPKSRRAGCMMCKPHKANWAKDREQDQTMQERRSRASEREQREEV